MCLTIKLLVSSPLASAFASAFFNRPSRNSADLTGHRARETPNCLPGRMGHGQCFSLRSHRGWASSQNPPLPKSISCDPPEFSSAMRWDRTLGGPTGAPSISSHGNSLFLLLHVFEKLDGTGELPSVDGLGGLSRVLEGSSEVGATCASRLGGRDLGGSVSNLEEPC